MKVEESKSLKVLEVVVGEGRKEEELAWKVKAAHLSTTQLCPDV